MLRGETLLIARLLFSETVDLDCSPGASTADSCNGDRVSHDIYGKEANSGITEGWTIIAFDECNDSSSKDCVSSMSMSLRPVCVRLRADMAVWLEVDDNVLCNARSCHAADVPQAWAGRSGKCKSARLSVREGSKSASEKGLGEGMLHYFVPG